MGNPVPTEGRVIDSVYFTQVTLQVLDASDIPETMDDKFEVVYIWDALHDIPQVGQTLQGIHRILKKDGHLIIVDPDMESGHSRNHGDYSTMIYGISFLHCLPVSMAIPGSQGLGAAWGKDKMRLFCTQAGLRVVQIKSLGDGNIIAICTK